ncbi:uncharacterized protein BDZ83DRAFT_597661 [Colletotrichum acutatum]|uniref:Uncharacterized protein n=1 Tax=Glomerella acutata TaxID=27357 RepID=A0AAD9D2L0_GLOAC|nr:uncharacterized protein BDZ83DRAFT_597661 [Colletotrichum acutatum]KAK1731482.1 hypothetical protein BDZ83DRAFT_597661 [Colletotrichum acutatum]
MRLILTITPASIVPVAIVVGSLVSCRVGRPDLDPLEPFFVHVNFLREFVQLVRVVLNVGLKKVPFLQAQFVHFITSFVEGVTELYQAVNLVLVGVFW